MRLASGGRKSVRVTMVRGEDRRGDGCAQQRASRHEDGAYDSGRDRSARPGCVRDEYSSDEAAERRDLLPTRSGVGVEANRGAGVRAGMRSPRICLRMSRMPVNRAITLVTREPLDGAYLLLTFRHTEVACEARGSFVMIKAGTRRTRPSTTVLDPSCRPGERNLHPLPEGGRRGDPRARRPVRRARRRSASDIWGDLLRLPANCTEAVMVAGG